MLLVGGWRCARVALVMVLIGAAAVPALAQESSGQSGFLGLLRSRDLSPFGFNRLDMRPAHAVSGPKGTWAVEAELGYQNTWALSPQVESYLTGLESQGRRTLGPQDVEAIRALPGENYLVDLELALLDLTFHYKFAEHFTAYATVSGVVAGGGFLDSSIESFHDAFGFSSFGRPAVKRNQINVIYDLKTSSYAQLGERETNGGGVLDPTFGIRYSNFRMPTTWNLVIESAVKVPLQGYREYLSSGRVDVGLQATLQKFYRSRAFYLSFAGVYYDGSPDTPVSQSMVIPTVIFGVEQRVARNTNVILQLYGSESTYSREETDLDELLKNKYQASLGVYHHMGRGVVSFAMTENLQNLNNTPDIGFQIGWAYSPALARRINN